MANALVIHKNRLPEAQRMRRAAQYVRMSTDYQRYSIENQAAAIAAYAQLHGLSIVRTYSDKGESGLKIKNRAGLTQLLEDVRSGRADFGHVLVFDVSRWGRFQDIDESAHYEFICKQSGVKVVYCAEQFDNDGSLISSIVKNIKRVMAAEYSRELSAKVHAGAVRLAGLGFKVGGPTCYGLQRLAVDEASQPKGILADGEHKFLRTDHVRVLAGTADERAIVQWIFQEYLQGKSQQDIRRELNLRGVPTKSGGLWSKHAIGAILRNESYIGNLVYNRVSKKLGSKPASNPRDLWIRSEGCVEPIVDRHVFFRVQERLAERHVAISAEEMLARLRKALVKKGSLTGEIIDATAGLPCMSTYMRHFGTRRNLYRLIGYNNTKYWGDLEASQRWAELKRTNGVSLCEAFEKAGARASFDPSIGLLRVNDTVNICVDLTKCRKSDGRPLRWAVQRRVRQPMGWTVAIRLGENNKAILDYVLLPSPPVAGNWLWFSEEGHPVHKIERFETFKELTRSLVRRVNKATRSTPAKRQRLKAIVLRARHGRRARTRQ
jgi:DNA invertase Pin-like site-specific DNA recombinase